MTAATLARDMLAERDIAALPQADERALVLGDSGKRAAVIRAYENVAPMYWGPESLLPRRARLFGLGLGAKCGSRLGMQGKVRLVPSRARDRYWIEVENPGTAT